MKKLWLVTILIGMVGLLQPFSVQAEQATPTIVVFDHQVAKGKVVHYTQSWIPNSDLTPQGVTAVYEQKKILRITYRGKQGKARSTFDCKNIIPEATLVRGIRLTLDSNLPAHQKLHTEVGFTDNSVAVFAVTTQPGMRTYDLIEPHFRTTSAPLDWQKISFIALDNDNPTLELRVKKVELLVKKSGKITNLDFKPLPVCEVVPQHFTALKFPDGSNLQAQLKIGASGLQLQTTSQFAHKPVANIKKHDDSVFVDEALEIFFSPELDNRSFRQFVINAAGTVFDMKFGFDPVAASFIYQNAWTMPHQKKQSFSSGVWRNELQFPWRGLGNFEWRKSRLMGFQIVQDYVKSPLVKPIWSPADFYPTPEKFGLLYFNLTPFGSGKLDLNRLQAQVDSTELVRFIFGVSGENLRDGAYTLSVQLASPIFEKQHFSTQVQVKNGRFQHQLLASLPCQNGNYNYYLTLTNAQNNMLAQAGSFVYSIPLRNLFGQTILCPTPKQRIAQKGTLNLADCAPISLEAQATPRTRQTAQILTRELAQFMGKRLNGNKYFRLKIAPVVKCQGKNVTLKPEGYHLQVSPQGVEITGADEPGLYYGTITLLQLAISPGQAFKRLPIASVEIVDYPDTPNRIFRLPHPDMFRGMTLRDWRGVDYLLKDFERFVAMQKFNVLELDIVSMTRFERQKEFNGPERVFTLDDWRRIAQFCRERFIRFVPAIQFGGHEDVWFLGYHPDLRIPGYANTGDVRNARHNQIVLNCIDDLLDATDAKLFLMKADEWYQIRKSGEKGLTDLEYRQAFRDCFLLCYRHLKSRGVRMAVFDDMFNPMTNGVQFDIYRTLEDLPKDVLILHWGGMPLDGSIDYFTQRGYEVWASLTSVNYYSLKSRRKLSGYGTATYGAGRYYEMRKVVGDSCSSTDAVFYGAEYGWNLLKKEHPSFISKIADGTFPALRERAAFQAVPYGSGQIVPLKLVQRNRNFTDWIKQNLPGVKAALPEKLLNIGHIPMQLSNQVAVMPIQTSQLVAQPQCHLAATYWLLGVCCRPYNLNELNARATNREWQYGRPAGDFIVHYADGTQQRIPLRQQENFDLLDTHPLNRSTMWNRCVWPLAIGNDRYLFCYQLEWVNPHPEKVIKKLTFEHFGLIDYQVAILALSGEATVQNPQGALLK